MSGVVLIFIPVLGVSPNNRHRAKKFAKKWPALKKVK
jgi:hypothetical protein